MKIADEKKELMSHYPESTKMKQTDGSYLYEKWLAKNRIMISEIDTLILAVILTKVSIVKPSILRSKVKTFTDKHYTKIGHHLRLRECGTLDSPNWRQSGCPTASSELTLSKVNRGAPEGEILFLLL